LPDAHAQAGVREEESAASRPHGDIHIAVAAKPRLYVVNSAVGIFLSADDLVYQNDPLGVIDDVDDSPRTDA
jgi:hypothetical protein